MKFTMGSHLTIAAKLSNDWGPPLIDSSRPLVRWMLPPVGNPFAEGPMRACRVSTRRSFARHS